MSCCGLPVGQRHPPPVTNKTSLLRCFRKSASKVSMTEKNDIEAVYPLSPMQQGILFHSLLDPESGQYFIQVSCTLRSEIDAEAFEQAWQQVAARHSILRTAFVWKNLDRMLQVVGRTVKVPFSKQDWRHLSADQQRQRFAMLLAEDRQRGFNLS